MRFKYRSSLFIVGGALVAAATLAAGCAGERAPVDQVQPNALSKSFFVGPNLQSEADDPEFYSRGTLVDVGGYGASQQALFTSTYGQPVSRVRWEITEDALIARLAYERIADSDGKGTGKSTTNKQDGQIVAAYRISSHFDTRRDYNKQTGEESNVMIEDTLSRPWYLREKMRVDFSKNLVTTAYDFDTLALTSVLGGGVEYEGLAYEVRDPGSIDAPHLSTEEGYLDITNKALAKPKLVSLAPYGMDEMYPACMVSQAIGGTGAAGNCNPVELTIRQSYRRVEANDYEPVDYDGFRFRAYGAFLSERKGYDRSYGMTDEKWHRFVERYDIWQRSHYYDDKEAMSGAVSCNTGAAGTYGQDPNADADGDGTADACAAVTQKTGVGGSQCDAFNQKCTLPFRLREAVPVVWYQNVQSTEQYFEASKDAAHEWDVAMRSAVQVAKNAECHATGDDNCDVDFPAYQGQMEAHEDATALSREVDACRVSGKSEADCLKIADELGAARGIDKDIIALAKMPEQVVLCHSPVESTDPAACGDLVSPGSKERKRLPAGITAAECRDLFLTAGLTGEAAKKRAVCESGTVVRLGDLRYHQVMNIEAPQSPSSWGIMTDASDPLTGRKVAAAINVFTHVNDIWAQSAVDRLRYGKGELSTEDVIDGKQVQQHSAFAKEIGSMTQPAAKRALVSNYAHIGNTEMRERMGQAAGVEALTAEEEAFAVAHHNELRKFAEGTEFSFDGQSVNLPIYLSRLQALSGSGSKLSPIEAQLITPAMQQFANDGNSGVLASPSLASFTRTINPTIARELRRMYASGLASRGACVLSENDAAEAADPSSNVGLAAALERKFGAFNPADSLDVQNARAKRMTDYIARRVHYAVVAHEMGHSIGLRHNFTSSADPINYRPQYWQLRTHDGRVSKACDGLTTDGSSCVGPRYYDPVDQDETDSLLHMWMQSSIMDYAGELSQDLVGLGTYDFAAARMFYGDAVALFKNPEFNVNSDNGNTALDRLDSFGGIGGISYKVAGKAAHYSKLQQGLNLISDCKEVDPQVFKPSNWNEAKDGVFDAVLDGHVVKVDGKYTRCKTQPVQYRRYASLTTETSKRDGQHHYDEKTGAVRVPYTFASDEWADLGNVSVFRHDNGGDMYELMSFFQAQPEVGHVFSDYRRGRADFSISSAANRNFERYNEKMRDAGKGLAIYLTEYKGKYSRAQLFAEFKEQVLAAGMAFDAFAMQMARPQAGAHVFDSNANVWRAGATTTTFGGLTIPDGSYGSFGSLSFGGRLLENRLLRTQGEFSREYKANVGSYYDKVHAGVLLTESVDNFIAEDRDAFADSRPRNVSFADVFPDGFRRFLGNNMTGDDFIKGVRVAAAGGAPLKDADGFPAKGLGFTSWWRATPTPCFPGAGSLVCASAGNTGGLGPQNITDLAVIDPQVSYEQQKFLWVSAATYLLENQRRDWVNQMSIYDLGKYSDPGFGNRIELHDPTGRTYVALSLGTEVIYGKTVQKGIAARMLEHANELLLGACGAANLTLVSRGSATWYEPKMGADGAPACNVESDAYYRYNDYISVLDFAQQTLERLDVMSAKKKD